MKQISRNQIAKHNQFIVATSDMYEAIFGQDQYEGGRAESTCQIDLVTDEVTVTLDYEGLDCCAEDDDDCDDILVEFMPRTLDEKYAAIKTLRNQVWYSGCYLQLRHEIAKGEVMVVSDTEWYEKKYYELIYPECQYFINQETWSAAQKNAKQIESELGEENLGPWTSFEWGMLNGKLSALRWTVGNDWDFLDT